MARYIEIAPHSRPTRTGSVYQTDYSNNRVIQRETPSMNYMAEKTSLIETGSFVNPTGICTDGTYLYFITGDILA